MSDSWRYESQRRNIELERESWERRLDEARRANDEKAIRQCEMKLEAKDNELKGLDNLFGR